MANGNNVEQLILKDCWTNAKVLRSFDRKDFMTGGVMHRILWVTPRFSASIRKIVEKNSNLIYDTRIYGFVKEMTYGPGLI